MPAAQAGYECVFSIVPVVTDALKPSFVRGPAWPVEPEDGPLEFFLKMRGRLCVDGTRVRASRAAVRRAGARR